MKLNFNFFSRCGIILDGYVAINSSFARWKIRPIKCQTCAKITSQLHITRYRYEYLFCKRINLFNMHIRFLLLSIAAKCDDIWAYLTDSKRAQQTATFVDHIQVLLVHNHMDVAGVDLARRCQCSSVGVGLKGYVATCTGCV